MFLCVSVSLIYRIINSGQLQYITKTLYFIYYKFIAIYLLIQYSLPFFLKRLFWVSNLSFTLETCGKIQTVYQIKY